MKLGTSVTKKFVVVFTRDFVDTQRPTPRSIPSYAMISSGYEYTLAKGNNSPKLNADGDLVIPHGVCYNVHLTVSKEYFQVLEETIVTTVTRRVIEDRPL